MSRRFPEPVETRGTGKRGGGWEWKRVKRAQRREEARIVKRQTCFCVLFFVCLYVVIFLVFLFSWSMCLFMFIRCCFSFIMCVFFSLLSFFILCLYVLYVSLCFLFSLWCIRCSVLCVSFCLLSNCPAGEPRHRACDGNPQYKKRYPAGLVYSAPFLFFLYSLP